MKKPSNTVPIGSLRDMIEFTNYNFEHIDRAIKNLQRRHYRAATMFTIFGGCYVLYNFVKHAKMEDEIYRLSLKVKRMENVEGE